MYLINIFCNIFPRENTHRMLLKSSQTVPWVVDGGGGVTRVWVWMVSGTVLMQGLGVFDVLGRYVNDLL